MIDFGKKLLTLVLGMLIATLLIAGLLYFINRSFFEKKSEIVTPEKSQIILPNQHDKTPEALPPGGFSEGNATPPADLNTEYTAANPGEEDAPITITNPKTAKPEAGTPDKIGSLIKEINANKNSARTPNNGKKYKLQAGSYQTPHDADGQRARLAMFGISSKIMKVTVGGREYYRVIINDSLSSNDAKKLQETLRAKNIDTLLISQ